MTIKNMPSPRIHINDKRLVHFMTITVIEWIDIFTSDKYFKVLSNSLNYCVKNKGLIVYAFVFMTNHTHLIVAAQDDLTVSIRDFKHYTTTEVKKLLKLDNRHYILRLLEHSYSRKKGSEFQIWQRENYPETITTDKFLVEKVDYLHNNPVVKGYVLKPEWWHYSSAGFYVGQRACPVNLTYVFD